MYRAWDRLADVIVSASMAVVEPRYYCPRCLSPAHLRRGAYRADHFAHNQGGANPDCEDYHPGSGAVGSDAASDRRLGLRLSLDGSGKWALFVEFPEIPVDECRSGSLRSLQSAHVKISGGGRDYDRVISGTDLWPGAGRNVLRVQPTHDDTTTVSGGTWPNAIHRRRWAKTLPGLDPYGVVFVRSFGGAFQRYDESMPVWWGQDVILIRVRGAAPPAHLNPHALETVSVLGEVWRGWRVALPKSYHPSFSDWLWSLGVVVSSSRERSRLVTPPHEYSGAGRAQYPVGSSVAVQPDEAAEVIASELDGHFSAYAVGTGRYAAAGQVCEVIGAVPGAASVRTDSRVDVLRFDLADTTAGSFGVPKQVWTVEFDGAELRPFNTYRFGARDKPVQIRTSMPNITFTLRATVDSGGPRTLVSADAESANEWIDRNSKVAKSIEIDCGNLGFIRIEFDSAVPERSDSSGDKVADGRKRYWRWSTAYAINADQSRDFSVPHWQASTTRQHVTVRRTGR